MLLLIRVSCSRKQDDCASGAAARRQKRALRQVSAATDKRVSCSRKQDNCASICVGPTCILKLLFEASLLILLDAKLRLGLQCVFELMNCD